MPQNKKEMSPLLTLTHLLRFIDLGKHCVYGCHWYALTILFCKTIKSIAGIKILPTKREYLPRHNVYIFLVSSLYQAHRLNAIFHEYGLAIVLP